MSQSEDTLRSACPRGGTQGYEPSFFGAFSSEKGSRPKQELRPNEDRTLLLADRIPAVVKKRVYPYCRATIRFPGQRQSESSNSSVPASIVTPYHYGVCDGFCRSSPACQMGNQGSGCGTNSAVPTGFRGNSSGSRTVPPAHRSPIFRWPLAPPRGVGELAIQQAAKPGHDPGTGPKGQ